MSRRRRTSCLQTSILILLSLACLIVLAGGISYFVIPQLAEGSFGPMNPQLGTFQRMTTSISLLQHQAELTHPIDPAGQPVTFQIRMGETANSVAERLAENGLVKNGASFRDYLVYTGLDTSIQAGDYQLSPSMSAVEIAKKLQDATPSEVEFNILPGWRAEEIAAALPTSGLNITPDDFLKVVNSGPEHVLPPGWPPGKSLEGFLLPGSYRFNRKATADNLVAAFTRAFDEALTDGIRGGFSNHKLSLEQAVTLASIVQREAVVADEQPMIASVFYNRLNAGMKLDSDPTVQYALGFDGQQHTWWTNPLSLDDLKVDSPYNTYQNPGLPPGPISNPSLSALQAVAYPAQSPYLYFRAACDGSGRHQFSNTYDEHLQNACK